MIKNTKYTQWLNKLDALFVRPIIDLFYPPLCFLCNSRLIGRQKVVCPSCLQQIPKFRSQGEEPFPDRKFDSTYILFDFDQNIRLLIHLLKYRGFFSLAEYFADMSVLDYPQLRQNRYDFIIPVPLHKTRLRERGFNQSAVLGKAIGHKIQVQLREDILIRRRNTPSQTHLDRRQRRENVANAFECSCELRNASLLIVDDVITTGSTLNACCETLRRTGAERLDVFALANPVLDRLMPDEAEIGNQKKY